MYGSSHNPHMFACQNSTPLVVATQNKSSKAKSINRSQLRGCNSVGNVYPITVTPNRQSVPIIPRKVVVLDHAGSEQEYHSATSTSSGLEKVTMSQKFGRHILISWPSGNSASAILWEFVVMDIAIPGNPSAEFISICETVHALSASHTTRSAKRFGRNSKGDPCGHLTNRNSGRSRSPRL